MSFQLHEDSYPLHFNEPLDHFILVRTFCHLVRQSSLKKPINEANTLYCIVDVIPKVVTMILNIIWKKRLYVLNSFMSGFAFAFRKYLVCQSHKCKVRCASVKCDQGLHCLLFSSYFVDESPCYCSNWKISCKGSNCFTIDFHQTVKTYIIGFRKKCSKVRNL